MKAVVLIFSHRTSKLSPLTDSSAFLTTPGPDTPTLITASPPVTPWNAPAIKGLLSGALQNTTSFIQSTESLSLLRFATSSKVSPISLTASILIPSFVEPRLIDEHTLLVFVNAFGIDLISISSESVIPSLTRAENPPIRSAPTLVAALSKVLAIDTKSSTLLQALEPTIPIGVTAILLLTIGIPYSFSIFKAVSSSFDEIVVILLYILLLSSLISLVIQLRRLIPIVMVLTSRLSFSIILLVSRTSLLLIIDHL